MRPHGPCDHRRGVRIACRDFCAVASPAPFEIRIYVRGVVPRGNHRAVTSSSCALPARIRPPPPPPAAAAWLLLSVPPELAAIVEPLNSRSASRTSRGETSAASRICQSTTGASRVERRGWEVRVSRSQKPPEETTADDDATTLLGRRRDSSDDAT